MSDLISRITNTPPTYPVKPVQPPKEERRSGRRRNPAPKNKPLNDTGENPDADEDDVVRFQVYLSPRDKKTVLGYSAHEHQSAPNEATFASSRFGVPVEEAFAKAKLYADQKGVSYLWIDDPDGLFQSGEPE